MHRSHADIVREYGPFPGADSVHGVTYDGQHVWFAAGDTLNAFDPASGKALRSIAVAAHAGESRDAARGRHFRTRVRRGGSFLLWWREERDGQDRPPARYAPDVGGRPCSTLRA